MQVFERQTPRPAERFHRPIRAREQSGRQADMERANALIASVER
jgi:hypothetical protein